MVGIIRAVCVQSSIYWRGPWVKIFTRECSKSIPWMIWLCWCKSPSCQCFGATRPSRNLALKSWKPIPCVSSMSPLLQKTMKWICFRWRSASLSRKWFCLVCQLGVGSVTISFLSLSLSHSPSKSSDASSITSFQVGIPVPIGYDDVLDIESWPLLQSFALEGTP